MHKCVSCKAVYADNSKEVLNGCSCGSKFFLYAQNGNWSSAEKFFDNKAKTKEEIQKNIAEMLGKKLDESDIIILNSKGVRMLDKGIYEIDVDNLMRPRIEGAEETSEGQFTINVSESIKNSSITKNKNKKKSLRKN